LSSQGFSITLEKLEFAQRYTRAYVSAHNEGDKPARLDLYGSKILQGSERVGQRDPFEYNVPKPQGSIQPCEQTEGVVNFGPADPSQPLQVSFAWDSGGFMGPRTEPLVFKVAP
jgi:hypothetical protein